MKRILGSVTALVGLGGGGYYYARDVEPRLLTTTSENLTSSKIPPELDDFTIVLFSDTHIGFHYSLEQFADLTDDINRLDPDLIVFSGDLVDAPDTYNWNNELIQLLQKLKANHGKYWIYGNHDHGGYGTETVKNVMDKGGFELLQNTHKTIKRDRGQFVLAGIDDVILGKPDLKMALSGADPDLFTILLAHEPDYADNTAHFPVDVQLSGHSHGGQVRLPFIGHLYTPLYAQKYVQGKHVLDEGNLALYVNRGIGTTRLPYRFFCRPEMHIFRLKS
ncbi:metallophosphoesterase [Lentibacillus halophilus]|uniref:Metallophosphoesterase n=1 Tax=Lentibacillus halophilus TaxID=295065 RepID=A0ABN0ZFR0_9BACI